MSSDPKFANMVQLYTHAVKKFGPRPLFGTKQRGEWKWMTYAEFGQQVDALRAAFAELGVGKGDRVAVIANNRPEWAIGAYATYGLRASYVPMYEAQLPKEWKYILNDCGAKLLLVANEKILGQIRELRADLPELKHVVVIDGAASGDGEHTWGSLVKRGTGKNVPAVEPEDAKEIAGFIYTSGTTGNPKGVLLSHGNLANNVSAIHAVFPMGEEDRSLSFLPWAHSFGQVVELHGLLSMGASMGIAESVEKIVDNLGEVQPTLLFSVPRIFNKIYDGLHKKMSEEGGLKKSLFYAAIANEDRRKALAAQGKSSGFADLKHKIFDKLVFQKVRARFGGRLKYAFSGGAALSKEVAEFIDNLGILVYEGYGLTETSPIATANWPGARKIGSVGKAIPGVRIEIDKSVTGDEVNGEIIVYGHNVMQGYYNLPEENAKVFTPDGGFRTGDMGHLDADGFLYITGRIKEQYKLENGKYVSPAPLEEHLKLSPFIANVMIYGDNKPYNVALVVADMPTLEKWAEENGIGARGEALFDEERVRKLFEEEIEKYSAEFKQFEKIRKFLLIAEDFTTANDMLTPSLKVKRRFVMKKYGERLDALFS
jgi:long-chain acyl-CoA synthetase